MEKTNARELKPQNFGAPPSAGTSSTSPHSPGSADLVTIDCSFISLRKILPPAVALLRASGNIVALIKPQFEAGKTEVDKGEGVITDPAIHERVLRELEEFVARETPLRWCGVTESPLLGPAGNKEFLVLLEKTR
jgi:23S rRNA (cytidine1920-2'-O)/16S rRNA (cytidine1409-2'-O)-methyltransferase